MHLSKTLLPLALAAVALTSCDGMIYDDNQECREGVELRFVYDYNMEWANAFPAKVTCLTVLVYDQQGCLVQRKEESSALLQNPDYRMAIDLPQGRYHVVAYGGMACREASFAFVQSPETTADAERQVRLNTLHAGAEGPCSDTLLHDHFFGSLDLTIPEPDYQYTTATVEMMQNTNHFRILLQQVDGKPLKASNFDLAIIDDNTLFASDNSLQPTGEPVRYQPWSQGETSVGLNSLGEEWTVAHYDLSTSRLIARPDTRDAGTPAGASSVASPQLVIRNASDGETIASLPIIRYLQLMKSDRYSKISNQEFLDRQSDWNVVLFLDSKLQWVRTHIVVNDWIVRLNDTSL